MVATGLWAGIEEAIAAAVSDLQDQIDAMNANTDAIDLNSLAELKAAVEALQTLAGTDSVSDQISDAIGVPSDPSATPPVVATGLWAGIEEAIAAAVEALEDDIADLQSQIDSNDTDIADIIDDTDGSTPATTNSIAGLKAALEALKSASESDLSDLEDRIQALEDGLDTEGPTIDTITITASGEDSSGDYGEGDVVTVVVDFDESVLVNGDAPVFNLNIGNNIRQATYVDGAGTDKLTFEYTLVGEDSDFDGISVDEDALAGVITDAAGNSADLSHNSIDDDSDLIVDNGPLELTISAGAIFGSEFGAENVLIGFLVDENSSLDIESADPVYLTSLDADGYLNIPDGADFVDTDNFFRYEVMSENFEPLRTTGPQSILVDLSGKQAFLMGDQPFVLTEDLLRQFLSTNLSYPDYVIEYILSVESVPAEDVWQFDGAMAGEEFGDQFLAQIAGRDPQDIIMTVTSPLTVAQAAALVEAGFDLTYNVTYNIRDYDTTVQAAMLVPATAELVRGADQVLAVGDELNNAMRFTSFDQRVNLRIEGKEGDDTIDVGRGDDEIVGGRGADVINLTFRDNSVDKVIYQNVLDGRNLPMTRLTFSGDDDLYKEGTQLTATINGHSVTYTMHSEDTRADALRGFEQAVQNSLTVIDPSDIVVGMTFDITGLMAFGSNGSADVALSDFLDFVTLDELDNGQRITPAGGELFIPIESVLLLNQGNQFFSDDFQIHDELNFNSDDADNLVGGLYLVGAVLGVEGGQTFSLSNENIYRTGEDGEFVFMSSASGIETVFGEFAYLAEQIDPSKQILSGVKVNGNTVTFYGAETSTELTVEGGGDGLAAIENPGRKTVFTVDFSSLDADWPTETNDGFTTEFEREISITIDGVEISADIVFDASGDTDIVATLDNLLDAILAENQVGGDIAGLLSADDSYIDSEDFTLVLTGATAPSTDDSADAPTFEVESVDIETNGEQQQTEVTFSSNDDDYYEGGKLRVEIAGEIVEADMVDGDAGASVQNLRDAVELAANGLKTGVFDFTGSSFDLTADAELNDTSGGKPRYNIDIKIGDVSVLKQGLFGDTVPNGFNTKKVGGVTVDSDPDVADTVADVVEELNRAFDGVAVFALDADGDKITFSTGSANSVTSTDGVNPAQLQLQNKLNTGGGNKNAVVTTVQEANAAIAAVLESVEQPFEIAQVVGGYSVKNLVESGSPEYVEYAGFAPEGGFYLAAEKIIDPDYSETIIAFGNVGNIVHPFNYRIDETVERVTGTYFDTDGTTVVNADFVYFENVQAFVDSLKKGGDPSGALFKDDYDVSYIDGTLKFTQKVSGPGFADLGTAARLNIGELNDFPKLVIKASTEEPDPLKVNAELDYQGERQEATFDLEDGPRFDENTFGDDVGDRNADVYFEGGKVFISITGEGADGILGNSDDLTVVVSADMGSDADETTQNLVDEINSLVTGVSVGTPAVVTLDTNLSADATLDIYNSDQGPSPNLIMFGYKASVDSGWNWVKFNPVSDSGSYYLYAYYGDSSSSSVSEDNEENKVRVSTFVDFLDDLGIGIFNASINDEGDIVFESVAKDDNAYLEIALRYADTTNSGTEDDVFSFGNFSSDFCEDTSNWFASESNFTGISDEGEDGVQGSADPILSDILSGASIGSDDETVTLTARDYGKETFQIDEVRLDYQGVKQQASITLDTAGVHGSTFTDGATLDDDSYGRGAKVYYANGKVYVTISNADGTLSTTVSTDMVSLAPAVATLSYSSPLLETDAIGYGGHNLVFSSSNLPSSTVNLWGSTMAAYLAGLETSSYVQSAELVNGKIVITFVPEVNNVTYAESGQINRVNGQMWFTSGSAVPGDAKALTSEALTTVINDAINGTNGATVDPVLAQLLESAEVVNGSIVLTAKNYGEKTFEVTDVALDYEGQNQIAEAYFSISDDDYYEGGTLSITIDTTPDVADGVSGDVVFEVSMDADDANGSLQRLVDAINAGESGTATPAVITIDRGGSDVFALTDTNISGMWDTSGDSIENSGVLVSGGFFVAQWELLFVSEGRPSYSIGGSGYLYQDVFTIDVDAPGTYRYSQSWLSSSGTAQTGFGSLGAFLTYLESLDVIESAEIVDGDIKITAITPDGGGASTLTFSMLVKNYGPSPYTDDDISYDGEDSFSDDGFSRSWFGETGTYFSADNLSDSGDAGEPGNDFGVTATLEADGTITLTSSNKTEHSFDIKDAELSYEGVQQEAIFSFSSNDDDYFNDGSTVDSENDGVGYIGVTINSEDFTQRMVDNDAEATVLALFNQIQSALSMDLSDDLSSVDLSDDGLSIILRALEPEDGSGEVDVSDVFMDVDAIEQVTVVDFGDMFDTNFVSADDSTDAGQVQITINGIVVSADFGGDIESTLENLRVAIDANASLDDVVGSIDVSGDTLVITALDAGSDDMTVSDVEFSVPDDQQSSTQKLLFKPANTILDEAVDGTVITLRLNGQDVTVTVGSDDVVGTVGSDTSASIDAVGDDDRGDQILQFLIEQAIAFHASDDDTTVGSIERGYVDNITEEFISVDSNDRGTVINVEAVRFGDQIMGVLEELFVKVSRPSLPALVYGVDQIDKGELYWADDLSSADVDIYTGQSGEASSDAVAGADEIRIKFGETGDTDLGLSLDLDYVSGDDDAPLEQDFQNPDSGRGTDYTSGDSDFFGDSPLTGVSSDDLLGIDQDFMNPDSERVDGVFGDGSGDGNDIFWGDDPMSGSVSADGSNDVLTGEGVQQSHTNPGSGYESVNDSPSNSGDDNSGDDDLYGSDPGYYSEDGLYTEYLNGGVSSGTSDDDGNYLYNNTSGDVVISDDVNVGASSGTCADDDSSSDVFLISLDDAGLAPFEWDSADVSEVSLGNDEADIINNFQTAYDFIELEGSLLRSTVEGESQGEDSIEGVVGSNDGALFDLDLNEFGLLDHNTNLSFGAYALNADDLGKAKLVSDLLNFAFDFDYEIGMNDVINTSVFAVTAADNDNVTAIWVHQQSWAGDDTVEDFELSLLATVYTRGDEFQLENFLPEPNWLLSFPPV